MAPLGVLTFSGHINLVDAARFINPLLMERIICWNQGIFDVILVCICIFCDCQCDFARASEIKRTDKKTTQKTNKPIQKSIFSTSETPPIDVAPLFGGVGKKPTTHSSTTRKTREIKEAGLCTLQNHSKVPASRGIVLECMLQQHTKRTQGKRKATHANTLTLRRRQSQGVHKPAHT